LGRSYLRIEDADLQRLAQVAMEDREDLFSRNASLAGLYRGKVICVTLCQGAAQHYVDGKSGVKDFDVWTFYRAHADRKFPPRRNVPRDFGDPKFGKSPDRLDFVGRRVDCIGRSIACKQGQDPFDAVREWLRLSPNPSPRMLKRKAAVVLEPSSQRGRIIWPEDGAR